MEQYTILTVPGEAEDGTSFPVHYVVDQDGDTCTVDGKTFWEDRTELIYRLSLSLQIFPVIYE